LFITRFHFVDPTYRVIARRDSNSMSTKQNNELESPHLVLLFAIYMTISKLDFLILNIHILLCFFVSKSQYSSWVQLCLLSGFKVPDSITHLTPLGRPSWQHSYRPLMAAGPRDYMLNGHCT